jgi:hypothetical protein
MRTKEELDEEAENFMKIIQKAAWKNTPVLKRKTMGNFKYKYSNKIFHACYRHTRIEGTHTIAAISPTNFNT